MDPDVFITAAFVSWVALIAGIGAAVVRHDAATTPADADATATFNA